MDRNVLKKHGARAPINNWETREFSLVVHKSKAKINPKKESDNAICIELEHISKESGHLLGSTSSNLQRSTKNVFKKGNVLFGKLRPNLRKYLYCEFDGVCSSEIWVLEAKQGIYPKFLFYLVQQDRFISSACVVSGSKMPRADWDYVSKIPFQVPPLPEQKAIAETLQAWDTAIEKTEKLITEKEKQFGWLRSSLIRNVKDTTVHQFGDLLSESRMPDTENNPKKRITVRLHLKGVSIREYRGTESEGATQYFVRKAGQLIYGKQNIFRGSIGIIPNELDGYSSSQDIPAFDIADKISPSWLFWYMSQSHFYKRLEHFATGSGSKRLHPKELFRINIAVPTFEQQKRIAETLNTFSHKIDLLKKLAEQYRKQKRGLMQKLLTGEWRVKQ